jgi:protein O-mannosyl-transferase
VVVSYLITMIFPHPVRLALDHEVAISSSLVRPLTTLPAVAVILAAPLAALAIRRRHPLASFLILGFLVSLAPESTFIPIDLMGDHRIYLYSLFVIPGLAALAVLARPGRETITLITAALILSGVLTFERNQVWHSPRELWRDSASKSPGLARPWSNYCSALIEDRNFLYALSACNRALTLDPALDLPAVNKAVALMALGRREEAGDLFQRTAESHVGSALAQYDYGRLLESRGDAAGAEKYYLRALHADEFHFEARLRLALLMLGSDRTPEARKEAVMLTKLFPDRAEGWLLTAEIMAQDGGPEAENMLRRAEELGLSPDQKEWRARIRRMMAARRPSGP